MKDTEVQKGFKLLYCSTWKNCSTDMRAWSFMSWKLKCLGLIRARHGFESVSVPNERQLHHYIWFTPWPPLAVIQNSNISYQMPLITKGWLISPSRLQTCFEGHTWDNERHGLHFVPLGWWSCVLFSASCFIQHIAFVSHLQNPIIYSARGKVCTPLGRQR